MRAWLHPAIVLLASGLGALAAAGSPNSVPAATVTETEGSLQAGPAEDALNLVSVGSNLRPGDFVLSGAGRAVLRLGSLRLIRMDGNAELRIGDADHITVLRGLVLIDSGQAGLPLVIATPTQSRTIDRGQVFVRILETGKTFRETLDSLDAISDQRSPIAIATGHPSNGKTGKGSINTSGIEIHQLLQWALYYPVVVLPEDLHLEPQESAAVQSSYDAYCSGDLLGAARRYPDAYRPASDDAKAYQAATFLANGRVEEARGLVSTIPPNHPARRALALIFAAILKEPPPADLVPRSASEALALSYYLQLTPKTDAKPRTSLERALDAAEKALAKAPNSGYCCTRVAELEFSFGRFDSAFKNVARAQNTTPDNAQMLALRGFIDMAKGEPSSALASFQGATERDGALGNGWLGLGLLKIKRNRKGDRREGIADLQMAVMVEPTRSIFYSYLGKALGFTGVDSLKQAQLLDPKDPTPFLYSAVEDQNENRYNEAVDAMKQSISDSDNRQIYRSQFLLDQDRAMRSANLATIYQNDGMADLAVLEASRSEETDYANSSAHLFLADSFDALRDPNRISLRYETAWFNEQLLADMLAPVGGGPLSQFVSQQEYSPLLESDGWGGNAVIESRGSGYLDAKTSLYGTFQRLSVGLDFSYMHDGGYRPNNASWDRETYLQFKFQASPDDIVYALGKWQIQSGGDLFQTYSNQPTNPGLHFHENQLPGLLLAGWNHRWTEGVNTLFLAGRLSSDEVTTAPATTQLLFSETPSALQPGFLMPGANGSLVYTDPNLRNSTTPPVTLGANGSLQLSGLFEHDIGPYLGAGPVTGTYGDLFDYATDEELTLGSAEIQQIWQKSSNTLIAGARWQDGTVKSKDELDLDNPAEVIFYTSPAASQNVATALRRGTVYAYDFWDVGRGLTLIGGYSWDRLVRPSDFRNPPINGAEVKTVKNSPKFGFVYAPPDLKWLKIRGAYTESLGGVSFDESVRLEPVQLAGFDQAYRTVISESLVGSVDGPTYRNRGLTAEISAPAQTWWSLSYNILDEGVDRTIGVFDVIQAPVFPFGIAALPASTPEVLGYREEVLSSDINRLLGKQFAVAIGLRHTRSRLLDQYPAVPISVNPNSSLFSEAELSEALFAVNWNSPTGWFGRVEADWYSQNMAALAGGQPVAEPPGDAFWQSTCQLGFRFARNKREISAGILDLNDRDYNLTTLTYFTAPPHRRTFFVRCRVSL